VLREFSVEAIAVIAHVSKISVLLFGLFDPVGGPIAGIVETTSTSGPTGQTHVRRPEGRLDARSRALAACVVDFKYQNIEQRGSIGRSLVTVSPKIGV
jgi:hypothetical protein